jgi:alkylation response protein AidB-like acyl-CoA dehydrogenase
MHSSLSDISIQQSSKGLLPKSLLCDISSASAIGSNLFKSIDKLRIQNIDLAVYKKESDYPQDIVLKFSKEKLYSKWIPKFVGGGGAHPLTFYGLNLEMGSHCLGIANLIGAHYVALGLVSATSSFEVLSRITADITEAENNHQHCTVALGVTEPGAGSDMEEAELLEKAKVCTIAKKVQGGFQVSGQKIFISNSLFAKWYIVSAFENSTDPAGSLVIFAVKADTLGISLGRNETKLGQSATPASVIFFENVFIPESDVCFSRDQFKSSEDFKKNSEYLLNDLLSLSRAGVGCLATGVQRRILEIMVESNNNKKTDSEWSRSQIAKVAENFILSKTISWEGHIECYSRGPYKDLQTSVGYTFFKYMPKFFLKNTLGVLLKSKSARDSLREKRRKSITMSDEKLIFGWGSLTKAFCSDKAMESTHLALELIGSDGGEYFWELEKILRDVKLLQIYEGTNELNRLMIYKSFIGSTDSQHALFTEGEI